MKERRGFTLVEVTVVLVILAILAAVMVPAMTGWIDESKKERLTVSCRACVLAAQTLATEAYGISGSGAAPDAAKVTTLAGVAGKASGIAVDKDSAAVDTLTYEEDGNSVTYERLPTPRYTYGKAAMAAWAMGTAYNVGDTVVINGVQLECIAGHTATKIYGEVEYAGIKTGLKWQVTGYNADANNSYSRLYRYKEGAVVKTASGLFRRTDYDPSVSPTPADNSKYWERVTQ